MMKRMICLMTCMGLTMGSAHAGVEDALDWCTKKPWYVQAAVLGAVVPGVKECAGWVNETEKPREPFIHRIQRINLILFGTAFLKSLSRINSNIGDRNIVPPAPSEKKVGSDTIYCTEVCKSFVVPIIYESAVELAHKTGIEACFKKAYTKLTAYVGRPSAWVERMTCAVASSVAKTAISKTLDSFDPTMPRRQRQKFGFSPLVSLTARFGYDN